MKVVAYFAVSADGFIAGEHDDVSWVSAEAWKNYKQLVSDARLTVIGHRTYDLMKAEDFIDDCRYLVLTSSSDITKKHTNVEVSDAPREALIKLKSQGHQCACVMGGAKTFMTLMQDKLIHELYLAVEPVLIGTGIRLFEGESGQLKLLSVEPLKNGTTVRLHYRIVGGGI